MCISLILASDKELPILQWAEGRAIRVSEIQQDSALVAIFSKPHLYHIGAHFGCGCGFYGRDEDAYRAREQLSAFLEQALDLVTDLELFTHWCGVDPHPTISPSSIDTIGPDDFRAFRWDFKCDEFLLVVRDE
jgi:hypothetical protein